MQDCAINVKFLLNKLKHRQASAVTCVAASEHLDNGNLSIP